MSNSRLLLNILFSQKSAWKIIVLTILSFSFSISVILCTIGLMDGFENVLRSGLRSASGDVLFSSYDGFYLPGNLTSHLDTKKLSSATHLIESEAFILYQEEAKGVLVRGIESSSFNLVSGLNLNLHPGEVIVGEELFKDWSLQKGSELVITLAKGNPSSVDLPVLKSFKIVNSVKHGVYEKDSRMIYVELNELQNLIGTPNQVNLSLAKLKNENEIETFTNGFNDANSDQWRAKPYWREFSSLIEAVEVEKFSISLILQLIIVVAIFNIAAMMIYLSEKRAQEFFLVQALGLDKKDLILFWSILFFILWFISCIIACLFSDIFNFFLQHSSFLQVPGDIYVIHDLKLKLDLMDYLFVFGLSFGWILLVAFYVHRKLSRQPILQGLRMEYT